MNKKTHKLLWLDVETTGLDHTTGDLLEIGAALTNLKGEQEDHWRAVIKHDLQIIKTALANDGKTALAMHSQQPALGKPHRRRKHHHRRGRPPAQMAPHRMDG